MLKDFRGHSGDVPDLYYEIMMARLAFVLVFENAIVTLKLMLAHGVGDVPKNIKIRLRREDYAAREAMDAANVAGGHAKSAPSHINVSETASLDFDTLVC